MDTGVEAGPWDCVGAPNETFPPNAMTLVHLITTNSLQPIVTSEAVDGGSALYPVQYTPLVGEQVRAGLRRRLGVLHFALHAVEGGRLGVVPDRHAG